MKKVLILASAIAAMTACTSDNFVGDDNIREANGQAAISFGFDVPAVTRATGQTAAEALSNQFIVYGEKNETDDGKAPTDGNLVIQNYLVKYTDNTAYTTTSNTKNWEYVGIQASSEYNANITPNSGTAAQTVKYWDYSADNYVFTAVSAKQEDITAARVKIEKTTAKEDGNKVYDKGYSIVLAKSGDAEPYTYPDLSKLYFADRNEITKPSTAGTDRTAENAYGGNVTLKFRNLLAHVRAGVYETIPGYAITSIKFYVSSAEAKLEETSAFGAIAPNIKAENYVGTLTVTYYNDGVTKNQPKVTASGTPNTDLILGTNLSTISTSTPMGTAANAPTWDTSAGAYTKVLPQINNTTNLKLKVDYTLYNSVTGETIKVTGATAEVPAQYLAWKPNYKYTYLFKISDGGNGSTGGGVTGLYPITFDAVTVEAEDGQAEYITTVSEPSITTFGVKDGRYVTGSNDYPKGSDVYATFMEGSDVKEPVLSGTGSNVKVYKVETSDQTNFPITEASVAEAVAENATGTKKITASDVTSGDATNFTAAPAKVATVPGEDGVEITINALKLTGVKAGTYAIEYTASTAWTGDHKTVYKIITVQ